jgi:hypothetical protein
VPRTWLREPEMQRQRKPEQGKKGNGRQRSRNREKDRGRRARRGRRREESKEERRGGEERGGRGGERRREETGERRRKQRSGSRSRAARKIKAAARLERAADCCARPELSVVAGFPGPRGSEAGDDQGKLQVLGATEAKAYCCAALLI